MWIVESIHMKGELLSLLNKVFQRSQKQLLCLLYLWVIWLKSVLQILDLNLQ